MILTAAQVRAARAVLGWTLADLSERAGVARSSVQLVEKGSDARASTLRALAKAIRAAGIDFGPNGRAIFWDEGVGE
ncbi:hypothetical protein CEW88_11645 [Alloyangia pacifica]|uniref:HTH cro/C1-type domain-containing protein n=2 Tax=Alloyangia pacifica TaxID=311180 RepID=A0A2U8HEN6_9RHOB|nr:hypothetical protein CEW88_11645 [Alloyangia pacifica]